MVTKTYIANVLQHTWTPDRLKPPNDVGFVEATDMELSR